MIQPAIYSYPRSYHDHGTGSSKTETPDGLENHTTQLESHDSLVIASHSKQCDEFLLATDVYVCFPCLCVLAVPEGLTARKAPEWGPDESQPHHMISPCSRLSHPRPCDLAAAARSLKNDLTTHETSITVADRLPLYYLILPALLSHFASSFSNYRVHLEESYSSFENGRPSSIQPSPLTLLRRRRERQQRCRRLPTPSPAQKRPITPRRKS
jgi:hypothetical protein